MLEKPFFVRLFHKIFSNDSMHKFQKNLLTGLFVALPTIATIWIISFIIKIIGTPFGELINKVFADGRMGSSLQLMLGFIIAITFLTLLGYFAKLAFMKTISKKIEDYITAIPIVNTIYSTTKSLINSVRSSSQSFQNVALVEFPRQGLYSIGFITQPKLPKMKTKSGAIVKGMTSVFVPTTPNPTSGFFLILPEKDVEILDISIEEGLKLIVTAGAISPTEKPELFKTDAFETK